MLTAFTVTGKAVATILLADFAAGFVHWLEDAYVREDTPVLGPIMARPNIVHHHFPRHFTRNSWWESNRLLVLLAAWIVAGAAALGTLNWQVWLFAALAANANEFHKWAHRSRAENGTLISLLQDLRILQSPRHHARHHTDPKNSHYCTTTSVLNPVLDGIGFWSGLEWLLATLCRIERREDSSLHGHGPRPAWLETYRPGRGRTDLASATRS